MAGISRMLISCWEIRCGLAAAVNSRSRAAGRCGCSGCCWLPRWARWSRAWSGSGAGRRSASSAGGAVSCSARCSCAFFAIVLLALWRPVLNVEQHPRPRECGRSAGGRLRQHERGDAPGEPLRRQLGTAALEDGVIPRIASSSDVRLFGFSDRAPPMEAFKELAGGAPQTRIGDALETVPQMAASVPVAAVVLVTDGAETGGTLSEAALARLRRDGHAGAHRGRGSGAARQRPRAGADRGAADRDRGRDAARAGVRAAPEAARARACASMTARSSSPRRT